MSRTPARILVASDVEEPAADALRAGAARARSSTDVLGVCQVLALSGDVFPDRYASEAGDRAAADDRVRNDLRKTVTSITGRTAGEIFVEHGTTYAEIVRCAESWRATLVVVGSGPAKGTLGGIHVGIAVKVTRYVSCSALVVRPLVTRGIVVCATDLSPSSAHAVRAAVDEARIRGAELHVLHVVAPRGPFDSVRESQGMQLPSSRSSSDFCQGARAEIDSLLARERVQAVSTILEGHAATTILEYAQETRAEFVVVGASSRTGLSRILLGNIAERIVREAAASVMVVRHDQHSVAS
jgi:nucleotide-binding universal stress UspA family protein